MRESTPIWFLTFAEMVPQACLWCLQLFLTLALQSIAPHQAKQDIDRNKYEI